MLVIRAYFRYLSYFGALQLGQGDTASRGGTADTVGDDLPFVFLGQGIAVLYAVAANHFTCVLLTDETVK